MKRALCIWLPEWPIQRHVVAKHDGNASGTSSMGPRPVSSMNSQQAFVLHARDSRRGQLVVACCSAAKEQGVRIGMPLAEVSSLQKHYGRETTLSPGESRAVERRGGITGGRVAGRSTESRRTSPSPGLKARLSQRESDSTNPKAITLHEHEPELDEIALSDLAIWCEQFSPIVGIEQTVASKIPHENQPSSLLLDITGLAPIFGSEQRLVELIQHAFQQLGYQIRIGIGDTIGAAWAIAHYADRLDQRIESLPIEALRLPSPTLDILHQLGIESIDQLMQLPRDGLATRLGETLIQRIDQMFGQQSEVIVAHRTLPEFESEFLFEHPTYRRHILEKALQQLTEDVTQLLAKHDYAAVQIEAELFGQRTSKKLFVSLFQPTSNPKHIYDLLLLQLEAAQMREQVKRIRIAAVTSVRIAGQQHVLWDEVGHGVARRDSELAQLVDRLSSRLGKDCVFGVQAQAGALPEKAYRKKLLTETIKSGKSKRATLDLHKQRTADTLRAPHRPLWLHEPPEPLQLPLHTHGNLRVRSSSSSSSSPNRTNIRQPPKTFQFLNQQHEVAYHWGPERIETGWWSGKSVRRDYYRVETVEGCRFWLFRQLDNDAWFLHGCFE